MKVQYVRDKANRRIGVVVQDDEGRFGYALHRPALGAADRAKAKEIALARAKTGKDYAAMLITKAQELERLHLPTWKLDEVLGIMYDMQRRDEEKRKKTAEVLV